MTTFNRDLKEAHLVEQNLADLLTNTGCKCVLNDSKHYSELKKYDILATTNSGLEWSYEVKYDRMCMNTGNVAVEYKSLSHTEADWYVYLLDNTFYFYRTEAIKSMIISRQYKRSVSGGDQNHLIYLFDMQYLIDKSVAKLHK